MKTWILILMLFGNQEGSISTEKVESKEACEAAGQLAQKAGAKRGFRVFFECAPTEVQP